MKARMSNASPSVASRRRELYGRGRRDQYEALKQSLSKSTVLKADEYNFDLARQKSGIYKTSHALDYKGQQPDKTGKQYEDANLQLKEHYHIGKEGGEPVPTTTYRVSTMKQDYDHKETARPLVVAKDRTVNWPDMAPDLSVDRSVGKSTEYSTSFPKKTGEPPLFPRLNAALADLSGDKAEKMTAKRVNVVLGSDANDGYESESHRMYSKSAPAKFGGAEEAQQTSRKMKAMEWKSSVLREGDYNNAGQSMASTFNVDYSKKNHQPATKKITGKEKSGDEEEGLHPKLPHILDHSLATDVPNTFRDAEAGRNDQESAHFFLGSDQAKLASVYSKDISDTARAPKQRPFVHKAPADSGVLQRDPLAPIGKTVTGEQYGDQVFPLGTALNKDVHKMATKNMGQRHGNNVVIAADKARHQEDRQVSLSHGDYTGPPSDFKAEIAPVPRPEYNHLETETALPFPVPKVKATTKQLNSTAGFMDKEWSVEQRQWTKEQTKPRKRSGLRTHFTVGYSPSQFESENRRQFDGRPASDQNVKPAGKTFPAPRADFDHIKSGNNTRDLEADPYATTRGESLVSQRNHDDRAQAALPVHAASLTRNDYMVPGHKRFTEAQSMVLRQNDILSNKPIASSHLFHMDTSGGNNLLSTARSDFIKPELMTSRSQVTAR